MQAIEGGLLGTCNVDSQHLQCPVKNDSLHSASQYVMGTACQTLTGCAGHNNKNNINSK